MLLIIRLFGKDGHSQTVFNTRKKYCKKGLTAVRERKQRGPPPIPRKLDGEKEARLITMACSQPPKGYAGWTLDLLTDKMVELKNRRFDFRKIDRALLKKRVKASHQRQCWVIPPQQNAEFIAHTEDFLDLYHRRYDPDVPLICMDELPVQLLGNFRESLTVTPRYPLRLSPSI